MLVKKKKERCGRVLNFLSRITVHVWSLLVLEAFSCHNPVMIAVEFRDNNIIKFAWNGKNISWDVKEPEEGTWPKKGLIHSSLSEWFEDTAECVSTAHFNRKAVSVDNMHRWSTWFIRFPFFWMSVHLTEQWSPNFLENFLFFCSHLLYNSGSSLKMYHMCYMYIYKLKWLEINLVWHCIKNPRYH